MYEKAIVEVLEVIDHMDSEVTRKIPPEVIRALIQKMDPKNNFIYDESKDFSEQNISIDAQTILAVIFIKYIATAEEKKEFKELLNKNNNIKIDTNFNLSKDISTQTTITSSKDISQDISQETSLETSLETSQEMSKETTLIKPEKWYQKFLGKLLSFFKRH